MDMSEKMLGWSFNVGPSPDASGVRLQQNGASVTVVPLLTVRTITIITIAITITITITIIGIRITITIDSKKDKKKKKKK